MVCNCCGKKIAETQQDYLYVKKQWGYFSDKDGSVFEMRICESCFDAWIWQFAVAPKVDEATELV